MSAKPVGESRADDRPWRRATLVRSIRDRIPGKRVLPAKFSAFPFSSPNHPRGVERQHEVSELEVNYDTGWAREPGARVTRRAMQATVLRAGIQALTSPTVNGLDRIRNIDGPIIFAANHHSHVDTGLLLNSLPKKFRDRTIIAAGADYFFDKKWKAVTSALLLNAVPIERKKVSRRSSDQLLELLHDNWSLVIFPEGGRSPDGWGQDFKPGAAFLAIRRACAVVPVHIEGTSEVLPKGKSLPKRKPCTVTFGAPMFAQEGEDARAFSPRIESAVAILADEHRSDWWTSRRNAAAIDTPSLGGPQTSSWRREWARTASHKKTPITKNEKKRSWP
jgi:1-acyl-sn-glycerol-3-phosphate acyltransferase